MENTAAIPTVSSPGYGDFFLPTGITPAVCRVISTAADMNSSSAVNTLGVLYNPYTQTLTAVLVSPLQQGFSGSIGSNTSSVQSQISSYGQLQSSLSALQSAAESLATNAPFSYGNASATPMGILTGSAPASSTGIYTVTVAQLAQGQTLLSGTQSSAGLAIGSGSSSTISFQFGNGSVQSVTIASPNNTLTGIASTINAANFGVSASVASNGSSYQLVLTGPTGAANTFNVSVSGDTTLASFLTYHSGGTGNGLTLQAPAQNALGNINQAVFNAPGNTLSNMNNGITLNLNAVGTATLNVTPNPAQASVDVQALVNSYNSMVALIRTDLQGNLATDSTLPALQGQMNAIVNNNNATNVQPYTSLSQIGIETNGDGTLNFNQAAFLSAYAANPVSVTQLFSNPTTGVATQLSSLAQSYLQPNGILQASTQQIQFQALLNQETQAANGISAAFGNLALSGSSANLTAQYSLVSQL